MRCECFVFFQAEDGIRDLVRSRGLGDVYKRQSHSCVYSICPHRRNLKDEQIKAIGKNGGVIHINSVSYTHLTLPTRDLV